MTNLPAAIVLMIDQLPASMLGPYGNTAIETETFNELAAESLVFDFAFADSCNLQQGYRTFFQGIPADARARARGRSAAADHANPRDVSDQEDLVVNPHAAASARAPEPKQADTVIEPTWRDRLVQASIETILITDDPELIDLAESFFDRVIHVEQTDPIDPMDQSSRASEIAETQLANFFSQAAAWIEAESDAGQLCWIHSRGLKGAWDAPYHLRQRFAGDEDPDPPNFVEPPSIKLKPDEKDLDQILGWQQAAAAQVVTLDQCLAVLQVAIAESPISQNLMWILAAPRGIGLGEHGQLGIDHELYSESIQIPLMIRFSDSPPLSDSSLLSDLPDSIDSGESTESPDLADVTDQPLGKVWPIGRSSRLVQLHDLAPLLVAWLCSDETALHQTLDEIDQVLPDKKSDLILISNAYNQMLQTQAWKLIRNAVGELQLYAKPDDRWEISNVSSRCPDIVEQLLVWLDRFPFEDYAISSVDLAIDRTMRLTDTDESSSPLQLAENLSIRWD